MLGIALIVLLGFILYYYRPKKLEMETRFQQSLFWAKIGTACFIGQVVSILVFNYYSLIRVYNVSNSYARAHGSEPPSLLQELIEYMTDNPLYPFSVMWHEPLFIVFIYLFPIVSVGLTHIRLIKPLCERKTPSQNWFHLIGLFSTTAMGGTFCLGLMHASAYPHASGFETLVLQNLPWALLLFSVLLVGVFAVEMSGYRLGSQNNNGKFGGVLSDISRPSITT